MACWRTLGKERQTCRLDSQSLIPTSRHCSLPIRAHWFLMPTDKFPWLKAACQLRHRQQEMWVNKTFHPPLLQNSEQQPWKSLLISQPRSPVWLPSVKCKTVRCLARGDPLLKSHCHPLVVPSACRSTENSIHCHQDLVSFYRGGILLLL